MAIVKRLSMRLPMIFVFPIAADFAIVRLLRGPDGSEAASVALILLPMDNLLFLSLPRLRKGYPSNPFWAGFQVAGWIELVVVGYFGLAK